MKRTWRIKSENVNHTSFVAVVMLLAAPLVMAQTAHAADKEDCKTIRGEYKHWDGHPPYGRVQTSDGKMYGLISSFEPDSDLQVPHYPLPKSIALVWDANEDVTGDFVFCFAKNTDKFKEYEIEPVELGWIKSFTPTDSSVSATFVRRLKIAAINAANKIPGSFRFGTIEVSFDYLDSVISNVEVGRSDGHDAPVLDAVSRADYPAIPDKLKGIKLHVELSIYFPSEKLEQEF
ncbi:MAG: hypothetical protein ACRETO_01630 [Gammaproteobacteria bacterium]